MTDNQKALLKQSKELELAQMLENLENPTQEIATFTIDLSSGSPEQKPYKIDFPFRSFIVRDASDASVKVNLKLMSETQTNSVALKLNDTMALGSRMRGVLSWDPQPSKSITIVFFATSTFTSGTINSLNAGGVSISDGASAALTAVTLVAATAAALVPTNLSRKVALIQNKSGGDLYVGPDSTVNATTNEGIKVADGATITWRNTATLFGFSVGGGKVAIMSES